MIGKMAQQVETSTVLSLTSWSDYNATNDSNFADLEEEFPTSNGTPPSTTDNSQPGPTSFIPMIVFVVLMVATIIENGLVILAYILNRSIRVYFNYFLVSMAVADLAVGLVDMPLTLMFAILGYWPLGNVACALFAIADNVLIHISILSVLVICVDRYHSIVSPLKHLRRVSLRRAVKMILPVYMASFFGWVLVVACLWLVSSEGERPSDGQCFIPLANALGFRVGFEIALYWLPLIVLIFMYGKLLLAMRRRQKNLAKMRENEAISLAQKKKNARPQPSETPGKDTGPRVNQPRPSIKQTEADCTKPDAVPSLVLSATTSQMSGETDSGNHLDEATGASTHHDPTPSPTRCTPSDPDTPVVVAEKLLSADNATPEMTNYNIDDKTKEQDVNQAATEQVQDVLATDGVFCEVGPQIAPEVVAEEDSGEGPDQISTISSQVQSKTAPDTKAEKESSLEAQKNLSQEKVSKTTRCSRPPKKAGLPKTSVVTRRNNKKIRTLSFIFLALVVSWTPWASLNIVDYVYPGAVSPIIIETGIFWVYLNSALNPLCYAAGNEKYRRAMMDLLRCRWKRR